MYQNCNRYQFVRFLLHKYDWDAETLKEQRVIFEHQPIRQADKKCGWYLPLQFTDVVAYLVSKSMSVILSSLLSLLLCLKSALFRTFPSPECHSENSKYIYTGVHVKRGNAAAKSFWPSKGIGLLWVQDCWSGISVLLPETALYPNKNDQFRAFRWSGVQNQACVGRAKAAFILSSGLYVPGSSVVILKLLLHIGCCKYVFVMDYLLEVAILLNHPYWNHWCLMKWRLHWKTCILKMLLLNKL